MTNEEKSSELFTKGYNCSQSVLGAFCEDDGLELSTALRLTAGFGGGMRCGDTCGAVTGALMAIGLKCGHNAELDQEQKQFCNEKMSEYIEQFVAANGSVMCRDLLGLDIRRPDDHQAPAAQDGHKNICPKLVASGVSILAGMSFSK